MFLRFSNDETRKRSLVSLVASSRSPFRNEKVRFLVEGRREGRWSRARPFNRVLKYLYAREYKSNRFIKGPEWMERGAAATAGFSGAWPGKQDDGRRTAILRIVGKKGRKRERGRDRERERGDEVYIASLPLLPFGCSIN